MKILVPILGFGPAGGYRVLSEMATQWVNAGHHVDFLVPDGSPAPYFPTKANVISASATGRVRTFVEGSGGPRQFRGAIWLTSLYQGLARVGNSYDVILANHSLTVWPVALARTGNARRFYYVQGYEPEYYWLERQPIKWLMSLLSYRFALEQVANAPIYCGHRNIRARSFVPPGLDLNLFRPSGRYRDFADGQPIVLGCIGRREPGKGTRYVLDAFERLNATDSRFRLRVAFGNLPEGWKHPACEIVVPDGDAELAEFYRSLDIMVAPGTVQHGAAHYPVLEAMACGIPIITTGYIPADEANSWIVANKNSTAIVDATHTIVSDPYYGERVARALEDIRSFAWPVVAARMLASFQEEAGA